MFERRLPLVLPEVEDAFPEMFATVELVIGERLFLRQQLVDFLVAFIMRVTMDEFERADFDSGLGKLVGVRADEEARTVDDIRRTEAARPFDRLPSDAEGTEAA